MSEEAYRCSVLSLFCQGELPTSLEWPAYGESRPPEGKPRCIGAAKLEQRIAEIRRNALSSAREVQFVAGVAAMRTNHATGKREVLLVRGGNEERFQFVGGKVQEGESHLEAMYREIREELGEDVDDVLTYKNTYEPGPDADGTFAIHSFFIENCTWNLDPGKFGGDVAEHVWTSDPFVDEKGESRKLYPQVRHMLKVYGFIDPFETVDASTSQK